MSRFDNLDGIVGSSFTFNVGGGVERTISVGVDDPNSGGPISPVQGDVFISDRGVWLYNGGRWANTNFASKKTVSGATSFVPANQQMVVHGTVEIAGRLTIEAGGQVVVRQ